MTHRGCRSRRAVVVALLALYANQSALAADFLVIEHVDRLHVYNKYQQEATRTDRLPLVPFVPMRILNADDVMGDGFSRCMQVDVGGAVLYLLKDKDGALMHTDPLGYEKTFTNATILLDSVVILADRKIRFNPVGVQPSRLPAGTLLFRFFRYRGSSYCGTTTSPQQFSWVSLSNSDTGRTWRAHLPVTSSKPITVTQIEQKVRARLQEANHALVRLFRFFSERTGTLRQPPQWGLEMSGGAIRCTLGGAEDPVDFEESTLRLANEIENAVLGSGFTVLPVPGSIEIRPGR
jgi:hypothetical protein